METNEFNRLAQSSSPYLLQHAKNPVDWYPWGAEALEKAKTEDKPILVSIGYSSCHWCHVMERETFEDDSIAAIMNKNFINIKVDREERPDVDQIYMDAVQTMGLSGGWPLNVFLTPDQKPFYGGTYFPPQRWVKLITTISKAFIEDRKDIDETASRITNNLSMSELAKYGMIDEKEIFQKSTLISTYEVIKAQFDTVRGGLNKAPKFPMPTNWLFLLRYHDLTGDKSALEQITLTLDNIANGGIHDHIGGGFARYSTDMNWFAPHFEKMLYDNGQLMSLFAEAYVLTGKDSYKQTISNIFQWLTREMTSVEGGFFSAIDADSEGEEGKFYVWKSEELKSILGKDYPLVADYYNITENGNWENQNNILYKTLEDEHFAIERSIPLSNLQDIVKKTNEKLLKTRNKKERPGLDNKIIAGWNGLMITGLVDAFNATGDKKYLTVAIRNGTFLYENMIQGNKLFRIYNKEKATIDGYLEDYALVTQALIKLYEATFEERWLQKATDIMSFVMDNFYDSEEQMFYFTPVGADHLIARKKEIFDNVIPSSNSQMALNLYTIGLMMDNKKFTEIAKSMLGRVSSLIRKEPLYLSNWMTLYSYLSKPTAEIIIVGEDMDAYRSQLNEIYIPNKIVMGSIKESSLPLLQYRSPTSGKTTVFVCYNKACKLPVFSIEDALKQIDK